MKFTNWILIGLLLQFSTAAQSSEIGDAFIKLGQKINKQSLSNEQMHHLYASLNVSENVLLGIYPNPNGTAFTCVLGTIHGPNNIKINTNNSESCSDTNLVYIKGDYACVGGYLYGFKGQLKWTGDSNGCGKRNIVKIGTHYACARGYIYGPGSEQWTGDSEYCAKAILD